MQMILICKIYRTMDPDLPARGLCAGWIESWQGFRQAPTLAKIP